MAGKPGNPIAFVASDMRDNILGVGTTLRKTVALVRKHQPEGPFLVFVSAWYENGESRHVPEDLYSERGAVTREEALEFVRKRAKDLRKHGKKSFHALCGILRCDPGDPEEKQIADYMASGPRKWLPVRKIVFPDL